MPFKEMIKKLKIRLLCGREKHDWEHYTWGNAVVDNLDDTFGFWDIGGRTCKSCNKTEYNLKDGWQEYEKPLTVNDLI